MPRKTDVEVANLIRKEIEAGKRKSGEPLAVRDIRKGGRCGHRKALLALDLLVRQGLVLPRSRAATVADREKWIENAARAMRLSDDAVELEDFLDLRRVLETFIAKKAAARYHNEKFLQERVGFNGVFMRLRELNREYKSGRRKPNHADLDVEADRAFHEAIAKFAGSKVTLAIFGILRGVLNQSIGKSVLSLYSDGDYVRENFKSHERLHGAIVREPVDVELAGTRAAEHIDFACDRLCRVGSLPGGDAGRGRPAHRRARQT